MHLLPQGGNATLPCRARARNVAKVVHAHVHHAQVGAAQRQRYRTTHRMDCASTTELGWLALMPERVAGDWALAIGACAVCWMRKDGPWALRVQGDSACWRVERDLHFVAPGPSSREDHRDAATQYLLLTNSGKWYWVIAPFSASLTRTRTKFFSAGCVGHFSSSRV